MYLYCDQICLPQGRFFDGYLKIENGKISEIRNQKPENEEVIDYSGYYILPGFIDIHIHGWGTGSFINDKSAAAVLKMSKDLPDTGVTSFLATSGAEEIDEIKKGIDSVAEIMSKPQVNGAQVLGVHLEGPFISAEHKGMQREECCLYPDLELMKEFIKYQDQRVVKLMTLAPELPNADKLIQMCFDNRIQVSAGHTGATFEDIKRLKDYGIGGVTHMFSGMRGFHHRELGVVGAAWYFDDLYCEFAKQTGMTVRPEAFALTYKLKGAEKIIMTTDCAGLGQSNRQKYHYIRKITMIPDGEFLIIRHDDGREERYRRDNYEEVKHLEMGYLESVQNMVRNVHPQMHEVARMTAENPAKYIGVFDQKGSLEAGKDADLIVLDKEYELQATYCRGNLAFVKKGE
ncbi:N-acetylglucosamine-6-phosphate deacetylase [Clostridiales bacterium COT073_COT-073]|nr:N-acetylglucosamine-6-phosphate deacetylase [Clostridiales bacterium COT073_COT-073]